MTENNIYFDPFRHRTCSRTTSKLEKKTNPLQLDTKAFTFYVAQQIKIKTKYFVRSTWSAQSSNSKTRFYSKRIRWPDDNANRLSCIFSYLNGEKTNYPVEDPHLTNPIVFFVFSFSMAGCAYDTRSISCHHAIQCVQGNDHPRQGLD